MTKDEARFIAEVIRTLPSTSMPERRRISRWFKMRLEFEYPRNKFDWFEEECITAPLVARGLRRRRPTVADPAPAKPHAVPAPLAASAAKGKPSK